MAGRRPQRLLWVEIGLSPHFVLQAKCGVPVERGTRSLLFTLHPFGSRDTSKLLQSLKQVEGSPIVSIEASVDKCEYLTTPMIEGRVVLRGGRSELLVPAACAEIAAACSKRCTG